MSVRPLDGISRAGSWSVEYGGQPFDDARSFGGKWYDRDLISRKYLAFPAPWEVIPLYRNGRPQKT